MKLEQIDYQKTWDEIRAEKTINEICERLSKEKDDVMVNITRQACETALPFLRAGRHINPIHHTTEAMKLLVDIMLAEPDLPEGNFMRGIVIAASHDSGNAFEPADEKKISKGDVDEDPPLCDLAITQRKRHMNNSSLLVEMFMRLLPDFFASYDKEVIKCVVAHHDDPTLAEYVEGKQRWDYLFRPVGTTDAHVHHLAALHREADRLWMLTVPGIAVDLIRKVKKGKEWNSQSQITHNVIRHWQERELYEKYFQKHIGKFRFGAATAFYRSKRGQELFIELQKEARKVTKADWNNFVQEGLG